MRWGQALIRELENLSWRIAHLRIQQAMTTEGITVSADAEPLVREAAITRARTVFQLHALRDRLDAQGNLRGSARAELIALAEELTETAKAAAAVMDGVEVTDGTIALATWEVLDSLPLVPTAHLAPLPPPPRPPRQSQAKQPQVKETPAKQPSAKSRRLTLEEAARRLGLSTGRVAELARSGELGRKEGGRWTFSEAEVRRVARERADHEKAVKLRKKLENDRRRLNGLPPKRRKQRRKARDLDDDDPPRRRRGQGLSVDDIGALTMLDQVLAQERALEQRYNLPFRAPQQTAALLHRCERCDTPLLFLIFGERAVDAAGLNAYGRLMEQHIKQNGVPAYVLGKANGTGDDAVSQLRRVWPDHGEVVEIAANRWEAFLEEQSQGHHCPP
ncbi:MAG: helix-turn-helix domain-containing protein [Chloroflexales bacterium]|nr:helix-turn-helix domain-containing protein [Chloroflexales bacterium]